MSAIRRKLAVLAAAIPLGCAAIAPARSSQYYRDVAGLGQVLSVSAPPSDYDYWSVSRFYLERAATSDRMNQIPAACAALSQSLAYYRKALAEETGAPTPETSPGAKNDDEGMQDIRSRFGCTRAQFG